MHGTATLGLLAGLIVAVAGCSGGFAPVESLTEAPIPGREREYLVGTGDTVYSIAWRHGVDYRVLAQFNSIRDPFTIFPGQRLRIPEPGDVIPASPEPSATTTEPVEPGSATTNHVESADVSASALGVQSAPLLKPLPVPSAATLQHAPPVSKPVPGASPGKAAQQPPAPHKPVPKTQSKPAAEPLATKSVAGLNWVRPTQGKAIAAFGRSGNKGIDIAGTFEQPIRAATKGRVVYAGSGLVGYGKLVIVKHSNRLLSAYAHNEGIHVKEGDEVKVGQHIADMGRSGRGRAMLHFEIRRDGKPVNPSGFLP